MPFPLSATRIAKPGKRGDWQTDGFFRVSLELFLKMNNRTMVRKLSRFSNSALRATRRFSRIEYGMIPYHGDNLSRPKWDDRGWASRESVRSSLLDLRGELLQDFYFFPKSKENDPFRFRLFGP